MDQQERLDYLVRQFRDESAQYRDLEIPADTEGKKRVLRSLMNIRMPKMMAPSVVAVQNEYLQERNREKGIISVDGIPVIAESGSRHAFADRLCVWQGDITGIAADAIVNAANSQMLGCFVPMHTCIDNCIHTFAGIQLRAECGRRMDRLRAKYGSGYEQPTAVPMLTDGYNLPAKHVIHIVGPIVQYRLTPELEEDLAACYRNTLELCAQNGFRSVAFCCISTGVFRFPGKRAAQIAVKTVTEWMEAHREQNIRVIFNVFKDEDREYYEEELL
ncbi:MAG: protein-ADP-ribose hydrolase [Lachnospiraceae bacterium]|nr:protein-ADP-ribose hydrolase [Lachnospiraceae bacterium]